MSLSARHRRVCSDWSPSRVAESHRCRQACQFVRRDDPGLEQGRVDPAMFARARVAMKAIETVLHLRREAPARTKTMVPDPIWPLVRRYGLEAETRTDSGRV